MAIIHPSGWRELSALGAAQREIETLEQLSRQLPDSYTVFHGVHWTRLQNGFSVYGEVDFVVIAPNARVLLIEQKSGFLQETADGLMKTYGTHKKSVAAQIARSIEGLQSRYAQGQGAMQPQASTQQSGRRMNLEYILYCPDYRITQPHIAGLEAQHIVDATRRDQLARIIQNALAAGPDNPAETANLCRFFSGLLELTPELGAVSEQARTLYSRLSGGLATWARQIELDPFRLRVIGTAGSGKTQLALAALRDAEAAGRRALYVCFNRPLADHLAQVAPASASVLSYHQLCDQVLRELGHLPDFSGREPFRALEQRFAECVPGERWQFDEIIVDEGQDFAQDWVPALLRLLRPGGRAWWLEDPMQNLYQRPSVQLPGWAVLRSNTNYRSPREILSHINRLTGLPHSADGAVIAGSPLLGADCEILSYRDSAGLIEQTKRAITQCVSQGFKRSMISVITYRGRESSALMPFDTLGPYPLRKFTGRYDLLGAPLSSDGDITLETVFRFKGQSSPAVVFTEIDFETLDENAMRRIFVGATRASLKLVMVVSERAAALFLKRLEDASDEQKNQLNQ